MAIQRYSFGTQKPDRDSEGDFVKYEDVKHLLEPSTGNRSRVSDMLSPWTSHAPQELRQGESNER
jgi:hypothetical protein